MTRKNRKGERTCVLCGKPILDPSNFREKLVSLDVLSKIRGDINTSGVRSSVRIFHNSCLEELDIPTKRRLTQTDWTARLLNIDHGVWIELDEYGKPKWDTLYSDEEDIDKELQRLKKKGLKNLDPKEKKWLKEIMN